MADDPFEVRGEPPANRAATLTLLAEGEVDVVGRLTDATNATFLCQLTTGGSGMLAVYKPRRGERPLDDFPVGTLGFRERAAFLVSDVSGWDIVPPTILRDDGPLGPGALQAWIDVDETVDVLEMVMTGDRRLRCVCLFDAITNNADRKGTHLLPVESGHVYGVDHGICFSREQKLRTVLWAWRGTKVEADEMASVVRVRALDAELGTQLRELLSEREVQATIRRAQTLIDACSFPEPDPMRPAVPWPPF